MIAPTLGNPTFASISCPLNKVRSGEGRISHLGAWLSNLSAELFSILARNAVVSRFTLESAHKENLRVKIAEKQISIFVIRYFFISRVLLMLWKLTCVFISPMRFIKFLDKMDFIDSLFLGY